MPSRSPAPRPGDGVRKPAESIRPELSSPQPHAAGRASTSVANGSRSDRGTQLLHQAEQVGFLPNLSEDHLSQLDQQMADLLAAHHDAVQRLAEVPGLGVDSAQQIIAEVGATAATFPSPKHLASWMGACPGNEESAGVNYSHRCPKGNRQMRRVLNQAANAAVKAKGTIFAVVYRRIAPRLGHAQAIGAITHRLCRLIWNILHERVRYEERGPSVNAEAKKVRARKMIRELRSLGYRVELLPTPLSGPA